MQVMVPYVVECEYTVLGMEGSWPLLMDPSGNMREDLPLEAGSPVAPATATTQQLTLTLTLSSCAGDLTALIIIASSSSS